MKHKQPLRRLLPLVLALAAAFALTISASAATNYNCGGLKLTFSDADTSDISSSEPQAVINAITGQADEIYSIEIASAGTYTINTSAALAKNAVITVTSGEVNLTGGGNDLTVNGGKVTVSGTVGNVTVDSGEFVLTPSASAANIVVNGGAATVSGNAPIINVSNGKVYAYGTNLGSISVTGGTLYLGSDSSGADRDTLSFSSLNVSAGTVYAAGTLNGSITASGNGQLFVGYKYSSSDPYYTKAGQQTSVGGSVALSGNAGLTVFLSPATNDVTVTGTFNGTKQPDLTVKQGVVNASGYFGKVAVDGSTSELTLTGKSKDSVNVYDVNEGVEVTNAGTVEVEGSASCPVTITNTTPGDNIIIDIKGADSSVTLGSYVTVTGDSGNRSSWTGISVASGSKLTMETDSKIVLTNSSTSTDVIGVQNSGGTVQINSAAGDSDDVPSISLTSEATPASGSTVSLTGVSNSNSGTVTLTGAGTGIQLTNNGSITATGIKLNLIGVNCSGGNVSVGSKVTMTNTGSGVPNARIEFTGVACNGGTVEISKAVTLTSSGKYVTMTGVDVSTSGGATVDNTGSVTLTNSCSEDNSPIMYGVSHTGSGTTDVKGAVTLTNTGKAHSMTGVSCSISGTVNVIGTVTLTNTGTEPTASMIGVSVSGSGSTMKVTGTVTVDNSGTTSDGSGSLVGAQSSGSATLNVTEAIITVTGKTGGNTIKGVNNAGSASVYLTDATVTLTNADGSSQGINNSAALVIYATKGLTWNASTSVYEASSSAAPASASVYVKTDNGTALSLRDNSYAAIRGAYGAAQFEVTKAGKALAVDGTVNPAVDGEPVIACGQFVDGTGVDANSTGNVLAANAYALLNGGVNYYVSDDSLETTGVYTVTDAVWAIQYYMGEATDAPAASNSAYTTDSGVAVFKLPCDVNLGVYDSGTNVTGYNYGMPGALATNNSNYTVAVAGTRTLDLNGKTITGSAATGVADVFTGGTEDGKLTVVNTDSSGGAIMADGTGNGAIALTDGDVVVKADNGAITITGKDTVPYNYGVTSRNGSVGVYTKDNAVVTVNGDVGSGAGSVTVGTYSTNPSVATVIVDGNVVSYSGDITLVNHGDGTDVDVNDDPVPYTGKITVYGYVASLGSGSVVIENGDNYDDDFTGAIYVLGEYDAVDAGVYSKGGSVEVYNVSTYSTDDAVKIVNAVQSGADDVVIENAKWDANEIGFDNVGNVTVGDVRAASSAYVDTYSADAAATLTLGNIAAVDAVDVYSSGKAAVVVTGNVSGVDRVAIVNYGSEEGCEHDSQITVYGYVLSDGNVVIENGENDTDTFGSAIYILGEHAEFSAGVYSTGAAVAVNNVSTYSSNPSVVAVKIPNGIGGGAAAAVVNGYYLDGLSSNMVANVGSVAVGNVTGGMVYVNSYTTNDNVTVDLGAIKSTGRDVIIYSEGQSKVTVNGDVNETISTTGDVGVYATDEAAVAILGTVYSGTSGDVLIENASAYDTDDPATSYAIKIAPTNGHAVAFASSGTLTIANNNEDVSNPTNGKILISANGDSKDGVRVDSADAKLKVSNEEGAVIEFEASGTGSYGLNISNASVPQSNIYITDSTATYTSVHTAQTAGVYKGLLGDAYDWKVDSTDLPRTAENFFTTPATNRTVRTTLGDNSSVYSVGAAVASHSLVVNPTSRTTSTAGAVTPDSVNFKVNGTDYANAAIVDAVSNNTDEVTVGTEGVNPTLNKLNAGSGNATVTYTDAYGSTATFTVNPTTPYVPSSGGGAAPAAITVPVSGESKSVAVSATVNGSVATMRTPSEQQLQSVIGASVHTGEVTIDMSGLGSSITTAAIPTETFKAISQAVSATNNDANALTIKVANGSVTFDATALSAIASAANASTVSLNVSKTNVSSLNAAQRAAVQAISSQAVYSITVTSGSKTIATFANGSATISVPYTLTSGQSAAGLVVWYVADNGTMTEIPCTFAGGRVVFTVTHFSNYVIAYDASRVQAQTGCPKDSSCPISAFSDASANAWYHDGVHWALENVIMSGWTTADGAKVFDPNGTTSRAMVAQILWNLEGRPAAAGTASFNDVADNAWYAAAVRWAAGAGIVTGYSDGNGKVFNPDGAVTREQLAAMLYRYAQSKGQGFQGAWAFPLNYPDAASVADWAYEAMCWMTMHGIINGVDGQLAPSASASRAVVATMLQRYTDVAK